ncbi:MAG: putative porin, partial [Candidatus Omnitrophota bacterium]
VIQLRHDLEIEDLPPTEVFATFGQFPLDDLAFTHSDPWLLGAQGGFKTKLTDGINWNSAVAFFPYLNIEDQVIANANTGNSLNGGNLRKEFDVIDMYNDITIKNPLKYFNIDCEHIPAIVGYTDVALNVSAHDDKFAILGGGLIGHKKVKKWPDWSLAYNYRYIERDAQLDAFPDADFHNGTNAQGHNIIFHLGTLKNTLFAAEWYHTRALEFINGNDYDNRLQLDASVKF